MLSRRYYDVTADADFVGSVINFGVDLASCNPATRTIHVEVTIQTVQVMIGGRGTFESSVSVYPGSTLSN